MNEWGKPGRILTISDLKTIEAFERLKNKLKMTDEEALAELLAMYPHEKKEN